MRKRLIFDVDGVLTDFHSRAREVIKDWFCLDLPLSSYTDWDVTSVLRDRREKDRMNAMIGEPGFAQSLIPDPEAVAAIKEMRKRGADILFATAPFPDSPSWKDEREDWLVAHFGASREEIAHIHRKYFLGGDLFVDDKPSHVEEWSSHNPRGDGRLFRRPYNAGSTLPFIESWRDILDLVKP